MLKHEQSLLSVYLLITKISRFYTLNYTQAIFATARQTEQETMGKIRINNVTTGTGDAGLSSLATGKTIAKSSLSIRALGGLDELNSSLGLAICYVTDKEVLSFLSELQQTLFDLGAMIALEGAFDEPDLESIERQIKLENGKLPALEEFVIPGGGLGSAHLHHCRTVCRRVEIDLWLLIEENEKIKSAGIYLNRLSDYLFIAARKISADYNQWRGPTTSKSKPSDIS